MQRTVSKAYIPEKTSGIPGYWKHIQYPMACHTALLADFRYLTLTQALPQNVRVTLPITLSLGTTEQPIRKRIRPCKKSTTPDGIYS